jgi:hypothetical protein
MKTIPSNPKMLIPDEFELFDIVYILMMQIYESFFKAQNKKTIILKNYYVNLSTLYPCSLAQITSDSIFK